VDWSGCDKSGANLSGVNLDRVNLAEANLVEANLSDAGLFRANLSGGELIQGRTGADLYRARLRDAVCNADTVWPDGTKGHGTKCPPTD